MVADWLLSSALQQLGTAQTARPATSILSGALLAAVLVRADLLQYIEVEDAALTSLALEGCQWVH